jgi:hypothetical protein
MYDIDRPMSEHRPSYVLKYVILAHISYTLPILRQYTKRLSMSRNDPIGHTDDQIGILPFNRRIPDSLLGHRIDLLDNERLSRDQISHDRHRSVASDVVHQDGQVVLSVTGGLPDLYVG